MIPAPPRAIPVTPDGPEAHEWILRELSKPEYAAARPTLWDRAVTAFLDWIGRLFTPGKALPTDWLPVILLLVIVAGIVVAIIIWGRPRARARVRAAGNILFGETDRRSAAQIRRAAAAAAAAGDYSLAVIERFRALARGLAERTIIVLDPGSTAREATARASAAFPAHAAALARSAALFDAVRYLDGSASAADWEFLSELDHTLENTTPILHAPEGMVPA